MAALFSPQSQSFYFVRLMADTNGAAIKTRVAIRYLSVTMNSLGFLQMCIVFVWLLALSMIARVGQHLHRIIIEHRASLQVLMPDPSNHARTHAPTHPRTHAPMHLHTCAMRALTCGDGLRSRLKIAFAPECHSHLKIVSATAQNSVDHR